MPPLCCYFSAASPKPISIYICLPAGCVRCRSLHQPVKHGAAPSRAYSCINQSNGCVAITSILHDFQWPIWVKIWCKHYNLHFVNSVHTFIQFTPFRLLFQPMRYSVLNVMSSVRGCTNSNSSVRASPSPSV